MRQGRNVALLAGSVLLWVSALVSMTLENGDCGGTADACAAARVAAGDRVRLLLVVVVVLTALSVWALRSKRPMAGGALLVGSGLVAVLGMWVALAQDAAPAWLPIGFPFIAPAAVVLVIGAARQLMSARAEPQQRSTT